MDFIDNCMESIFTCFNRKKNDEATNRSAHQPLHYLDPLGLLDDGKLEKDFEKLVEECGLSEERRADLRTYSREKKLVMLTTQTFRPEEDCEKLISLLRTFEKEQQNPFAPVSVLQDVAITLRTQCSSFVEQFVNADGVQLLSTLLLRCHLSPGRDQQTLCLLGAFRALLNSTKGRIAVLQDDEALLAIARAIELRDSKCKIVAVEILSGLCFVPEDGHCKVLKALTQVSSVFGERTRFQTLVSELHRSQSSEKETDRTRIAILGLINALLRTGHAESSLEFRVHLRCEFLMLGMARAATLIRPQASNRLQDHLDLFEMMRKEDEIVLSGGNSEDSGASSPVNFESASDIAEALHSKLRSSPALPHFMSLLQHLFMVPSDEKHLPLWRLFDLILQHLTLQATVQGMSDVEETFASTVDMEEILTRLHTHCDYERLESDMERMKEELDQERVRAMELDNRIADLNDGRDSISSRISNISSSPSDPCPSMSPLPPICPPAIAPPPPPPSLVLGTMRNDETQKRVPKPTGSLKSFNWLKLTESKVKGTAWEFIEDEKMYKQLDLENVASTFASSSQKEEDIDFYSTVSRRTRDIQVSVIDPRRYQNCTIMLSKLKLSHREIRAALLAMDDKGKLPKDMLEQMLKFVPSKEEINLLRNAVNRHNSPSVLALADRYLYEMAQIPRFEHRLRSLYIIRTFQERFDCLTPHIQSVTKASSAVSSSKKFKQLLALVLALGNYLNYGKRNGNAFGFDLTSLNRLNDVKFAYRSDRTLLHYILQVIDNRFPDLGKLRRELAAVYDAARYNRNEVLAEIRSLEQGITAVRSELAFMKEAAYQEQLTQVASNEEWKEDQFEAVAKQFVVTACEQYHTLEKLHSEMKAKFSACAAQFCFDTLNPEEMFGCLAKFLTAFCEAQQQLWTENEHKEQVKRQTIARSYFAKKASRRRENERDFDQLISALQSGDLFKDDLSRLRTSFRVAKKSRAKP
uniref:GBD/FH3 domain-containing protein n=1 Tax=Haemonchus contortus TaxID=6289 RepID=A0A7I4YVD0_HAECO